MISITTFYRFLKLNDEEAKALKSSLESWAERWSVKGLCLVGTEGINLTVSGAEESLGEFKRALSLHLNLESPFFKDSTAEKHPFQIFKVKIKNEIVTLGRADLVPPSEVHKHLSPSEWNEAVREPNTLVIDTRNDYEVEIGKFRTATDFKIKEFSEFPERLREAQVPKDQKILIYCTGGIRCEKAILAMEEQGYENVYQLNGGILNYLKECPREEFEGDCFVFDYRVAVDQDLNPAKSYKLCPHCGQPATVKIGCTQCETQAVICTHCEEKRLITCSKNCAHHAAIGSRSRKPHKQELNRRQGLLPDAH